MNRLGSIQRLRAAAALSVAWFHACQWSGLDFAVGAAGVDVFFVISGFVLWLGTEAGAPSPGRFLAARFGRVAPLYALATLAVAALVLWRPQAMPIAQFQPLHLVLSLLFVPHNDPAGDAFPLLPSGWTLTYEAFFYLVFALALACPRDHRLQVLCGGVLIVSLLGLAYPPLYPLLCNPLLLEFLAGVGLARLWWRGRPRVNARWAWTALGVGVLALVGLQVFGVRSDVWRPVLWGPPAVLIVGGAVALEAVGPPRRGRLGRALERLGDASYSLYLCQLPMICLFAWSGHGLAPLIRAPLAFALAIGAGLLCHRFIEAPLSRALKSVAPRPASGLQGRDLARNGHGRGLGPAEQIPLAAIDPDLA